MNKTNFFESESIKNSLNALWPLNITCNGNLNQIELGSGRREIWAFPLVGGNDDMDSTIYSMEERRKVIPAALARCASDRML